MSRALARLREIFGDPLLVRLGGGLAPTPLAEKLAPKAATALDQLRGLFRAEDFDPSTLDRPIRIAAADAQTILLAPRLVVRLQAEAPGVVLRFEPVRRDIIARMEKARSTSASRPPRRRCRPAPSASRSPATGLRSSCGAAIRRRTEPGPSPITRPIRTRPSPFSATACRRSTRGSPPPASNGGSR